MPIHFLMYVVAIIICCQTIDTEGARILMYPGPLSHYHVMSRLAELLHQKHHQITMLVDESSPWMKSEAHYTLKTFKSDISMEWMSSILSQFQAHILSGKDAMSFNNASTKEMDEKFCRSLLTNEHLIKDLSEEPDFDIAIVDGFQPCPVVFVDKIRLPFILFHTLGLDPVTTAGPMHVPSPVSYVPVIQTGLTDNMTFKERIKNALQYTAFTLLYGKLVTNHITSLMHEHHPESGVSDVMDLYRKAHLMLVNTDTVLEYPRPWMPHVMPVGGLMNKPAKPLSGVCLVSHV